jgi:hypothetical protein
VKAMITERRIAVIISSAEEVFIYWLISAKVDPAAVILMMEIATAAPSNSKTIDTVVEVGRAKVLKKSSRMISVIMTARNMIMISLKKNWSGWNIPFLATSIIPLEKVAPNTMPTAAIIMIITKGATLEPMAEFRKLTASLLTPTTRSDTANTMRIMTISRKNVSIN